MQLSVGRPGLGTDSKGKSQYLDLDSDAQRNARASVLKLDRNARILIPNPMPNATPETRFTPISDSLG